jgi:hypothetical protein
VLVSYDQTSVTSVAHVPCDVMRWHRVEVQLDDAAAARPERQISQAIDAATAADRNAGLLCAVRVEVRATAALHERLLFVDDVRDTIRGELQAFGSSVWLEKVKLERAAGAVDSTLLLQTLRSLADELLATPAGLEELARGTKDSMSALKPMNLQAAEESEVVPRSPADFDSAMARRLVERALDRIAKATQEAR